MEYTRKQIYDIIPHRFEMALLDGIKSADFENNSAIGIINLTKDHWFFKGHFPSEPIMPGVLQLEAIAQVGAFLILSKDENKGKNAYFIGMENIKFRDKVLPGQTIELVIKVISIRDFGKGSLGKSEGKVIVNGKVVTTCELSFYIG